MPFELSEAPAAVENVFREVSRIKTNVTEAVDEGLRTASRAIKHGRTAAEDAIDDTRRAVKRSPINAIGIAFAAGLMTGSLAAWIAFRRR